MINGFVVVKLLEKGHDDYDKGLALLFSSLDGIMSLGAGRSPVPARKFSLGLM